MEASASTPPPQPSRPGSSQPRRGDLRRGRGRGNNSATLGFRPASVAPDPYASSAEGGSERVPTGLIVPDVHTSSAENSATEGRQAGDTSRRGRDGRARNNPTVNGRRFGSQLTSQDSAPTSQSQAAPTRLQGDAPTFFPGQKQAPGVPRKDQPAQQPRQQKRRASKSHAADIATRTHEDIDNGYYECPICTSEVQRNSKVWACHTCWTVFHLTCIKKWSTNQGSAAAQPGAQNGEIPPTRQWRCPGCNLPKDVLPKAYTCWCEKETDPRPLPGLPPHSCGNICGKERAKKCSHPCERICHSGPCPPCFRMGPTVMCFCGKHDITKRCSETDYGNGWSCGEICGELMPCQEHSCHRACHEGYCGACEVRIPAQCYCGQVEKDILCCDRGDEVESHRTLKAEDGRSDAIDKSWRGSFECEKICDRPFDCYVHRCSSLCHALEQANPADCPWSPDLVITCPCRKTPLHDISAKTRETCTDPIANCGEPCGKVLACGHSCVSVCHTGNCLPCMKTVEIDCRCQRTVSKSICHQGKIEPPQCMRQCRANLNCLRHSCAERCCPGERKAIERQNKKRKQQPLGAPRPVDEGFEAEHICTRHCGRLLKCNNHVCQDFCHRGQCRSCREAIFEEIRCHCGRTTLEPPLPCGTQPPMCRFNCDRPKACGHPQVPHNCHQDDEACAKCPYLVEKRCLCGKQSLKHQPCWLQEVRCGVRCGSKLHCGFHRCSKDCHRPGECEDANGPCRQPCGKPKSCGHSDEAVCHAPYPCKEEEACQSKIYIMCECQAQKQEMKCLASKNSEGNNRKILPCNDECARLERNRRLALALNVDQAAHIAGGDHIPYAADTLNLFAQNLKWGQIQEREFRVFATSDNEKRLRFKPMKANERAFIHALAADFGLESESMDPEPHRHVMIWKTPRFVSAPNKTLAECLRIRQAAMRSTTNSAYKSDAEEAQKVAKKAISTEPYNGFLISKPRFGLTVDELRAEVAANVPSGLGAQFNVEFLPSEEVVLKAMNPALSALDLQQTLQELRGPLEIAIAAKGYGSTQLCATDNSLNILRRGSDPAAGHGWSRVAAKKAAPKTAAQQAGLTGGNNAFSALSGGKLTFAKKMPQKLKAKKEDVVDDWEAAEIAEEKKERGGSAGSADEGDSVDYVEADGALVMKQGMNVAAPSIYVEHPPEQSIDGVSSAVEMSEATEAGPERSTSADEVESSKV